MGICQYKFSGIVPVARVPRPVKGEEGYFASAQLGMHSRVDGRQRTGGGLSLGGRAFEAQGKPKLSGHTGGGWRSILRGYKDGANGAEARFS